MPPLPSKSEDDHDRARDRPYGAPTTERRDPCHATAADRGSNSRHRTDVGQLRVAVADAQARVAVVGMKVDQGQVTTAITAVRAVARGDDSVAAAEALRLARLSAPDCVVFLHNVVRAERVASPMQRVRAAALLLTVAGFVPTDSRATTALQEAEATDASADACAAS
jgi:hypothetical protein